MASYNKITIIGNLGADPQVKTIGSDKKVADFNIAVSDSYTDKSGQRQEKTEWYRVSFWNQKADVVEKFLKKGNQVHIEGKLSVRTYTDKEGKERYSLEVAGQDLTLLGGKGSDGGNGNTPAPSSKQPANTYSGGEDTGDDLPF